MPQVSQAGVVPVEVSGIGTGVKLGWAMSLIPAFIGLLAVVAIAFYRLPIEMGRD